MEIIDSQLVEEANQEEIDDIASLTEACLKLKGGDRPTMEEVEMRLQFLRTKRVRKFQLCQGSDGDIEQFLCPKSSNSHAQINFVSAIGQFATVWGKNFLPQSVCHANYILQ